MPVYALLGAWHILNVVRPARQVKLAQISAAALHVTLKSEWENLQMHSQVLAGHDGWL